MRFRVFCAVLVLSFIFASGTLAAEPKAVALDAISTLFIENDLWTRVQNHIGEQQGVLVKLALAGELADRAKAAGKDPRNVAMMTLVLDDTTEPKIVHVDDN